MFHFFAQPEPLDYGDLLNPDLPDLIEYLEAKDTVEVILPGADMPLMGTVKRVRADIQYALVDCWDGAQRWVSLDEMQLVMKGSALKADFRTVLSA